jgi:hypothetical protein
MGFYDRVMVSEVRKTDVRVVLIAVLSILAVFISILVPRSNLNLPEITNYPPGMFAPIASHDGSLKLDVSTLPASGNTATAPPAESPQPDNLVASAQLAWRNYVGACLNANLTYVGSFPSRQSTQPWSRLGAMIGGTLCLALIGVLIVACPMKSRPTWGLAVTALLLNMNAGLELGRHFAQGMEADRQTQTSLTALNAAVAQSWQTYLQDLRAGGFDVR